MEKREELFAIVWTYFIIVFALLVSMFNFNPLA